MSFAKSIKSVVVLSLAEAVDLNNIINQQELPFEFQVAGDYEDYTIGLTPFKEDGSWIKEVSGMQVVNISRSVKKVDKKKVKRLLKEKLEELARLYAEENPGEVRKFSKEEKQAFTEEISYSLLPDTEVDIYENMLVVDLEKSQVYITNITKKASEDLTSFIRDRIESFPVSPVVEDELDVIDGFAKMIKGNIQSRLSLGNYVKLEDGDGIVVWTKESLYESEASELMSTTGKQVIAMGFEFDGTLNFIADTEFTLKSLKWDKRFKEPSETIDSDIILCFNEIRGVIKDLKEETSYEE